MKSFSAHGKLLLSGEYMVMFGSKALALPLQLGQFLHKIPSDKRQFFSWKAYYQEETWFTVKLNPSTLKILETTDPQKADTLRNLIQACIEVSPIFQEELFRWDVETVLEFSPQWGLGSSSTLTALLAEWAEINPLDLHFKISQGSGYDVACAIAQGPILYWLRDQNPHYQHVPFRPSFADALYFAWLGNKQPTASHLNQVALHLQPDYSTLHRFSTLTDRMLHAPDLGTFQDCMEEHEVVLAELLQVEQIGISRFARLPGKVKSLGAWGGDFVMIASHAAEEELVNYLKGIGIQTVYRYNDLAYEDGTLWESTGAL